MQEHCYFPNSWSIKLTHQLRPVLRDSHQIMGELIQAKESTVMLSLAAGLLIWMNAVKNCETTLSTRLEVHFFSTRCFANRVLFPVHGSFNKKQNHFLTSVGSFSKTRFLSFRQGFREPATNHSFYLGLGSLYLRPLNKCYPFKRSVLVCRHHIFFFFSASALPNKSTFTFALCFWPQRDLNTLENPLSSLNSSCLFATQILHLFCHVTVKQFTCHHMAPVTTTVFRTTRGLNCQDNDTVN